MIQMIFYNYIFVPGKRILVIGSGVSAMDIAFLTSKVCPAVYLGQRTFFDLTFEMPDNLQIRPVVSEITARGAVFEDGTSCEVDTIIFATGYTYSFPFLHSECGIVVDHGCIQDLYKHCLNIKCPTMAVIGMPFDVIPHLMFDLQAQFCLKYWTGENQLPDTTTMLADTVAELEKRMALGWPRKYAHKMRTMASDYHDDLSDTAGLERTKPVFYRLALYFMTRMVKDYLNYRTERYEVLDDETFRTYY